VAVKGRDQTAGLSTDRRVILNWF